VLWAITPEGRVSNLGEVPSDKYDRKAKITVTTELQAFGLIVTAEPYFAVVRPSDAVVLENVIRKDTKGTVQEIDAEFDLVKRGQYAAFANDNKSPSTPDLDNALLPSDIAQARNAIRIATGAGATTFAPDTMKKAELLLSQAETENTVGSSKKASTFAREAVQTAEDARLVSMQRMGQLRLLIERQAMIEREAALKALAIQEIARIAALAKERDARANEEIAKLEADRSRFEAEVSTERMKADAATREAELAREEARRAVEESKASTRSADDREKATLRADLRKQLSTILETRDTARGLIVDLADVQFDTDKYALKTANRESLAKVAGILMTLPELTIEVEGHTDNVGAPQYNQQLSDRRAQSVREYFIHLGIPADRITARGFGESQPVASNETAEGRQQNRRVEVVVSGEALGTTAAGINKAQ
jgi:outer membrane protein OmpA-like peptidoglycan-associated protein